MTLLASASERGAASWADQPPDAVAPGSRGARRRRGLCGGLLGLGLDGLGGRAPELGRFAGRLRGPARRRGVGLGDHDARRGFRRGQFGRQVDLRGRRLRIARIGGGRLGWLGRRLRRRRGGLGRRLAGFRIRGRSGNRRPVGAKRYRSDRLRLGERRGGGRGRRRRRVTTTGASTVPRTTGPPALASGGPPVAGGCDVWAFRSTGCSSLLTTLTLLGCVLSLSRVAPASLAFETVASLGGCTLVGPGRRR